MSQHKAEWHRQLGVYHDIQMRYFTGPDKLDGHFRLQYLALQRGMLNVESWLSWAAEVRETIGSDV